MRTREIGTSTPVIRYSYLGDTETVVRIDDTATSGSPTDIDSALGPDGARILLRQTSPSTQTGWLIPDLHANVAAVLTTTGGVSSAIRYDAYGVEVGTPYTTGSAPGLAFRYQGRLDVAADTGAPTLYDMSARNYAPGLGVNRPEFRGGSADWI